MKMTVMIQYFGHVYHAGGYTKYRPVTVDLTPEQAKSLALRDDEDYGPVGFQPGESADLNTCEFCVGSGESGPDQVCWVCDGSGAE